MCSKNRKSITLFKPVASFELRNGVFQGTKQREHRIEEFRNWEIVNYKIFEELRFPVLFNCNVLPVPQSLNLINLAS